MQSHTIHSKFISVFDQIYILFSIHLDSCTLYLQNELCRLIMYYYKSYSMHLYNINIRYICQNFDTYVASFQQMSVVTLYLCTHIMCLLKGLKWCQVIRDETHEIIINFITLSILLQTCKYE